MSNVYIYILGFLCHTFAYHSMPYMHYTSIYFNLPMSTSFNWPQLSLLLVQCVPPIELLLPQPSVALILGRHTGPTLHWVEAG